MLYKSAFTQPYLTGDVFSYVSHCALHHVATSLCRGHVDELATEPLLLLHREHGTGYRRSWNCCSRRTHFVMIWKHFCFIRSRAPGYGLTLWCALGLLVGGTQYKYLSYSRLSIYSKSLSSSKFQEWLTMLSHVLIAWAGGDRVTEMSFIQSTLTFEKAFRGKYTNLATKIDTSHGLWNQLLDREVLTSQQISTCQVDAYFIALPFPPDWLHGLSDHLTILLCSTAGFVSVFD